jgi:predicted phosphohydrolase
MSIWAIADIHASRRDPETGAPQKPMEIFGSHWEDHVSRLEQAWTQSVREEDTVIVAGDIDWALHIEDAMDTLTRLGRWPGTKLLIRGNHDYWWSSKTTNRVRKSLPAGIELIHNNAATADGFNICGAKGSPVPGGIEWTPEDEKLLNRECQRLQLSLDARRPDLPTIVAFHYPPFYPGSSSVFTELMMGVNVECCVYGHLHGAAAGMGPDGEYGGIVYRLVAADGVDFRPVLIARDGEIVRPAVSGSDTTARYNAPTPTNG